MKDLLKKAIAEFIGTFTLVFIACGVASLTHGDLAPTALAFGLVIVAMAYSVGRISGCHINPAVSLGCLITKRMSVKEFCVYVVAQILGGFVGAMLLFGIIRMSMPSEVTTIFGAAELGLVGNASNFAVFYVDSLTAGNVIGALLTEIVLTCIFVYVILNVTDEKSAAGKKAGIVIGLTLTLVHLIGINLTGTSVNPARSIATAIGTAVYGGGTEALAQVWMFIVAPLAGAALAALLYKVLHTEKAE